MGVIIGTALELPIMNTMILAVVLGSWLFWAGMSLALTAGYIAAFPVNYVLVGKGIRHVH